MNNENKSSNENKPFNDVVDHINKIEGGIPDIKTDFKKMPKPIQYIRHFIIVCALISIVVSSIVFWYHLLF